jgi:hypothetical protein
MVVGVVVMVVASGRMGFAALGINFRATVTMRTIHHMRRDGAMNEAGEKLDDNHTSEKEADQNIGRGRWGEAGAREVVFGGGEHAIQRGEELVLVSHTNALGQCLRSELPTITPALRHNEADRKLLLLAIWKLLW